MISLNGHHIVPTMFPDGTSQVWHLPDECFSTKPPEIFWKFESEAEVMHLAQVAALLGERCYKTSLHISYLPYARQDKLISNQNAFALYAFAKILNSFNFGWITCDDPHSPIAKECIYKFIAKYPIHQIHEAWADCEADVAAYPDAGAVNKYKSLTFDFPYVCAHKTRDQSTGEILSYELCNLPNLRNSKVLIIDDICDGGATFEKLARLLYESGAESVNMFVSHGLFTKGIDTLMAAGIKRIFTKDGEI